jgi:leader peptidase (prepilin peptidase)/N-methyltransferase
VTELIPVISYLIQKGKCSNCKVGISPIYPCIELITGLLFALAPLIIGWTSELFIAWTLISLLVIIVVSDIAYMLIPDKVLLFFAVIYFVLRFYLPLNPWWDSLLGCALGFSLLLLIAIISRGGMGGGDIKLFALIGFIVGTKVMLLAFFLSCMYGAVFGIFAIIFKRLKRKQVIPFGPFIAIGTLSAYFFGDQIINLYFNLLTYAL